MKAEMWRVGQSRVAAFTVLEVLLVLTILSLVGTVVAFSVPSIRDRSRLTQTETWLENLLADVRGSARRQGRTLWLEFDTMTNRYRHPITGWRALPAGTTWSFEPTTQGHNDKLILAFLPDGSGSEALIKITSGPYTSILRVEQLSGTIIHVGS